MTFFRCARRAGFWMFAFIALVLLSVGPAMPQSEGLGLSLTQLISEARYDDARSALSDALAGQPNRALHLAQLEGVIRLREGRIDDAIAIFRTLLIAEPDFTPARVELARALRMQGETDAAYHHFELLANSGMHPALAQLAENAMETMRAERPYGASVRFSLAPSSNFNKGSGQETFDTGGLVFSIDEDSRAQSGLGVALGGTVFNTFALDANNSLTVSLDGDVTKYIDNPDFDHALVGGELTYTHRREAQMFAIGPVARYQWSGWEPYLASYGVSVRAASSITPSDVVIASFEALARDFAEVDYRDGWQATGTIALQHHFSPAASVSINFGTTLERTQRPHLDHNDLVFGLAVRNEWDGGLITSLSGSYEYHGYLGDYPATGAPRADHKATLGVTLAHRAVEIAGFMPQLSYQYSRQFSNVSFFDYDSHDFRLGLTRSF